MPAKGPYYTAVAIGALFVYAGLRGFSVLKAVQNVIQGHAPAAGQVVTPLASPFGTAGIGTGSPASGSLVQTALSTQGHCYKFGGAPGSNGTGCWDCSSAANWWLTQSGYAIPGGAWNPATHGPNTLSYLAWGGAVTIGHSSSQAQAGDLLVWQTHMGLCIGNGQMISALNPSLGTAVTPISAGPSAEILFVRRIITTAGTGKIGAISNG